jgi:hypothetical protein
MLFEILALACFGLFAGAAAYVTFVSSTRRECPWEPRLP